MGLGKTIQAIAYILSVRNAEGIDSHFRPFLVVAPLSTVNNWKREFRHWSPDLNIVAYVGNRDGRSAIRKHEFWPERENGQLDKTTPKFDVLITSYELCMKESSVISPIEWEVSVPLLFSFLTSWRLGCYCR